MKLVLLGSAVLISMALALGIQGAHAQQNVCQANPAPVDAGDPSVVVAEPAANASVGSPLHIEGQARVFQALVSGIGFIGAGAIIKGRAEVHGLATAVSLWVTVSVGIAAAYQLFALAAVLSLVLPNWAAFLITAAVFGIAGGLCLVGARNKLRSVKLKDGVTVHNLEEDQRWAKGLTQSVRSNLQPGT